MKKSFFITVVLIFVLSLAIWFLDKPNTIPHENTHVENRFPSSASFSIERTNGLPDDKSSNVSSGSSIEPKICSPEIFIQRQDARTLDLFPTFEFEEVLKRPEFSDYQNLTGLEMTYSDALVLLNQCKEWSDTVDNALNDGISFRPLSHGVMDDIASNRQRCALLSKRFKNQMRQDGINNSSTEAGATLAEYLRIKNLMKAGKFDQLFAEIESGKVSIDFEAKLAKGLSMKGQNLIDAAMRVNVPKDVLERLLVLGAPVTSDNLKRAVRYSKVFPDGVVTFLSVAEKNGINPYQIYQQTSFYDALLTHPASEQNPVMLSLMQREFDPNLIRVGTEDLLTRALKAKQYFEERGYAFSDKWIRELIKKGALVEESHLNLTTSPDLIEFMQQHQCVGIG